MIDTKNSKSLWLLTMVLFAGVASLQAQTMLERVMTVEDPQLGECIRVALKNLPIPERMKYLSPNNQEYIALEKAYTQERLQTVRTVTELYAQIKRLDAQIDQINQRLFKEKPDTLEHELLLARAELEFKRTQELAELRQSMRIEPSYAHRLIPFSQLNSWIVLDVLQDDVILIFKCKHPFNLHPEQYEYVNKMPLSQCHTYINERLQNASMLPIRIDIHYRKESLTTAQKLYADLSKQDRESQSEMDIEVRLQYDSINIDDKETLYLINEKMGLGRTFKQSEASRERIYSLHNTRRLDALAETIHRRLVGQPKMLPCIWILEHDVVSQQLAQQIAEKIHQAAQAEKLDAFIDIKLELTKVKWNDD